MFLVLVTIWSSNEGNNIYSDIVFFVSVGIVNDDFVSSINKFYLLKYKFQSMFSFKCNILCSQHDQSSGVVRIFSFLSWEGFYREIDVLVWLAYEIRSVTFRRKKYMVFPSITSSCMWLILSYRSDTQNQRM